MERVSRINDCKVELGRCTDEELYQIAMDAMLRAEVAELEVAKVNAELSRRHQSFMGDPECLE